MSKISRRPSRRNSRQGMLSMKQMTELARNAKNPDEVLGLDGIFEEEVQSNQAHVLPFRVWERIAGSTLPRRSPFGGGSGDADISGGSSTGDASEMNSVLREVLTRFPPEVTGVFCTVDSEALGMFFLNINYNFMNITLLIILVRIVQQGIVQIETNLFLYTRLLLASTTTISSGVH